MLRFTCILLFIPILSGCFQSAPAIVGDVASEPEVDGIPDSVTDSNHGEDNLSDGVEGDDHGESHEPDIAPDPALDPAPDSIPDLITDVEHDEATSCERFSFRLEGCNWYEHSIDHIFAGSSEPILHVVGMYESAGGVTILHISRTHRPVVLVLGAYESIEWIIDRADGARIEQILLYGYEHHSVSGADDVPVVDMTGDPYISSGYCWPFCADGGYTQDMVQSAEELTGLPLSTFNGCYESTELSLYHECKEECSFDLACPGRECGMNDECRVDCGSCPDGLACVEHACVACEPDCSDRACGHDGCDGTCGTCPDGRVCDEDGHCVKPDYFAGCEDVVSESHYCMTIIENGLGLVGLDSGTVCQFGTEIEYLTTHGFGIESIAWLDGLLYVCGEGLGAHGLLRINPLDASWELAPVYCEAVAAYNGGLVTKDLDPFGLMFYPSFDHAMALDGESIPGTFHASRMTVQGSTLYTAWHSTDEIDVFRLPSGGTVGTITLEDFDSWVFGISVTSDGLLLLLSMSYDIIIFDETTGSRINVVDELRAMKGLFCMTNP